CVRGRHHRHPFTKNSLATGRPITKEASDLEHQLHGAPVPRGIQQTADIATMHATGSLLAARTGSAALDGPCTDHYPHSGELYPGNPQSRWISQQACELHAFCYSKLPSSWSSQLRVNQDCIPYGGGIVYHDKQSEPQQEPKGVVRSQAEREEQSRGPQP